MSQKPHQLLLLLITSACTLRPLDSTDSATGTTTTTTSSTTTSQPPDAPSTSAPPTTTPPGTTTSHTATSDPTTGSTSSDFLTPPDGGGGIKECDQWSEDCPEGQKCMPYDGDGDSSWESLKCSDIDRNPAAPGEPCTVFGSGVSGEDTCEKHAMCWDVDPDTLTGTCIAICIGSPDAPACAQPMTQCTINGDGLLTLCLPTCDPIAQDCPGDDLCVPNPHDSNNFICVLDASGDEGQAFDPCEYLNACDPGLYCFLPDLATECDPQATGCCLPFCDPLLNPNTCPGQGQQCVPWYDPGHAPPGYENVGFCALP